MKVVLGARYVHKFSKKKFICTWFCMNQKTYYMLVGIVDGMRWDEPKEFDTKNWSAEDESLDEHFEVWQ